MILFPSSFFRRLGESSFLHFSPSSSLRERASLERGRRAVEDDDGSHGEVHEFDESPEESEQVCVCERVSRVCVRHRLEELHEPDGRVHRDFLVTQRVHGNALARGFEERPQPGHTHH